MNNYRAIDKIVYNFKLRIILFTSFVIFWGPPKGLDPTRDVKSSVSGNIGPYQLIIVGFYFWVGILVLGGAIGSNINTWKRIRTIVLSKINIFFLFFLFAALLSTFYSKFPRLTFFFSYQYIITYFFFIIYSAKYERELIDKDLLLKTYLFFLILNVTSNLYFYFTNFTLVAVDIGTIFPRLVGGGFFRPDYSLSALILLSFVLATSKKSNKLRYLNKKFVFLLGILSSLSIILAQTRSVFVILAFILVLHFSQHNLSKNLVILLLCLIFAMFVPIEKLSSFIIRDEKTISTFSGRIEVWKNLMPILLDNIISGYGYYIGGRWLGFNFDTGGLGNLHNSYLELVAGIGILPSMFFIITIFSNMASLLATKIRFNLVYKNFIVSLWIIVVLLSITNPDFAESSPIIILSIIFTHVLLVRNRHYSSSSHKHAVRTASLTIKENHQ